MTSFVDPRAVLKRHGIRPKDSWGQNLLVSAAAVDRIAELAVPDPGGVVIEIGAGPGTLTRALLARGARVIAVERDREMCRIIEAELGDTAGFTLAAADAATFDYSAWPDDTPGVIAGNIPYQITGRILRRVLETPIPPIRSVLTIQAEVAERLVAKPGDSARGALSAMADARCEIAIAMRLQPGAFSPMPKVRSAVVVLETRPEPLYGELDGQGFDAAVKAAFSTRRKTVRNALLQSGYADKGTIDELLRLADIDPGTRAERLDTLSFAALARAGLNKVG
jgi:16S rRNA (adenine1518-N6/adenine1519-N6)-dimethyltransferase